MTSSVATPGSDISALLGTVPEGGTLFLPPGDYPLPSRVHLEGRTLEGLTGGQVRLHGQVYLAGTATLRNLTVMGPSDGNAVLSRGGTATLVGCTVVMPDDATFRAVASAGARLRLDSCTVTETGPKVAIAAMNGTQLVAADSQFGTVSLEQNSVGQLRAVRCRGLNVYGGSTLQAVQGLEFDTRKGLFAAVVSDGSQFAAESVTFTGEFPPSVLVDASTATLTTATAASGRTIEITAKHGGAATADPATCVVLGTLTPAAEVTWKVADGDRFAALIAPRIGDGTVLRLEEGAYTIPAAKLPGTNVTVVGAGRSKTSVHLPAGLGIGAGIGQRFEHCTLIQTAGHNALNINGGQLELASVTVIPAQLPGTIPAVFASNGARVDISSTVLEAAQSRPQCTLYAIGARVTSRQSFLGWVECSRGASATFSDDVVLRLQLETSNAEGTLSLGHSSAGVRPVFFTNDSAGEFDYLAFLASDMECYVRDSRLTVEETLLVDQARLRAFQAGTATVELPQATLHERRGEDWVEVEVNTPAVHGDVAKQPSPVQLDELIGLDTVKRQVRSFLDSVTFATRRKEAGLEAELPVMHSMFLGNPGTGKTTVARLVGQALFDAGAVRTNTFVEVGRADLVAEHIGGTAQKTNKVLESARGGVLFIDEAYDLHSESGQDFGREAVNAILAFMENHRNDIVIIFAGYTDLMQDFLSMNPGLKSRIPHRFDFEDYTPAQLGEIGAASLRRKGYQFDEGELTAAIGRQYRRSGDSSNGRWVRNFEDKLTAAVGSRLIREYDGELARAAAVELSTITTADLRAISGAWDDTREEQVEAYLAQLDALTGLEPVKRWARDMVQIVEAHQRMEAAGLQAEHPTYHMAFTGNPGTGKTTVARIVAGIFHALGILETPTVNEVTRADLVGAYVGQTEKRTTRALDEAMGGVLFIDEAYQLTNAGADNDFGAQAVETLLPRLENDREKFITIVAGYTAEMEEFFGANPGLRSRVPNVIEFPDYTPTEVAEIVERILTSRGWRFDVPVLTATVENTYAALAPQQRSNGRWARTFADAVEREQKLWIAAHNAAGEELRTIADETIARAGR